MTRMFENIVWRNDRMLVNNLVFRLEDHKNDQWELGDECFRFYKTRRIIDQYAMHFRYRADFQPKKILELGTFDGGSLAFWFECFRPEKLVGIDHVQRTDSKYFKNYLAYANKTNSITTYWDCDQTDRNRLREIVQRDFGGSLDMVIDDASHYFEQTKISFETIFPLLRTGGLYIIEDWSWACWPKLTDNNLPVGTELIRLIFELTEAIGTIDKYSVGHGNLNSFRPLISNMTIYPDFVVLERGEATIARFDKFTLEKSISRSPQWENALYKPPTHRSPARKMFSSFKQVGSYYFRYLCQLLKPHKS